MWTCAEGRFVVTTPKAFLRVDFLEFVHVVPSFRSLTRPPDEN